MTCICIRGHFEENFYDENENLSVTIDVVPGGVVLNIEKDNDIVLSALKMEQSSLKRRLGHVIRWKKTKS